MLISVQKRTSEGIVCCLGRYLVIASSGLSQYQLIFSNYLHVCIIQLCEAVNMASGEGNRHDGYWFLGSNRTRLPSQYQPSSSSLPPNWEPFRKLLKAV